MEGLHTRMIKRFLWNLQQEKKQNQNRTKSKVLSHQVREALRGYCPRENISKSVVGYTLPKYISTGSGLSSEGRRLLH